MIFFPLEEYKLFASFCCFTFSVISRSPQDRAVTLEDRSPACMETSKKHAATLANPINFSNLVSGWKLVPYFRMQELSYALDYTRDVTALRRKVTSDHERPSVMLFWDKLLIPVLSMHNLSNLHRDKIDFTIELTLCCVQSWCSLEDAGVLVICDSVLLCIFDLLV